MNQEAINGIAAGNLATFSYAASKVPTRTGNNPAGKCPERAAWDTYKLSKSDWDPAGPFTRYGRVISKYLPRCHRTDSQTLFSWERFAVTVHTIS